MLTNEEMGYAQKVEMEIELRRRLKDRNAPGYWGANARAWAHKIIRQLRAL